VKLRRSLIAQCAGPSLGEVVRPGSPGPHIFSRGEAALDPIDLKQISTVWGLQFADCLIADLRWPTCNQQAAIRAAGLVVDRAIIGIVAILDGGPDFRPHTKMMAETIHAAFWNSMPNRNGT
jgi:hypothetical protein